MSAQAAGVAWPRAVVQALVMVVLMAAVAALSVAGKPVHKLADQRPRLQLADVVPEKFGNWRLFRSGGVVLADPQTLASLEKLYTQTLSRSYIDDRGTMIMLSIAYGDDQRATMAVHYPEVCYPAQGFQVLASALGTVPTVHGTLPVRRLQTVLSRQRYEPVSYWVTIGDRISLGGLERRLIELDYGMERVIPDGLLFRVSSVNRDPAQAFRDQDRFVADLMQSLPAASRAWLAGDPARLAAAARP